MLALSLRRINPAVFGAVGSVLLAVLLAGPVCAQQVQDRPNVLVMIADDVTYSDLSLYGGENVETPNIDQLARQGLVFDHAYQSMSMCVPTRSELYTGQYPTTNGSAWNKVPSPVRPGTESIVHHFREMGYRVGVAGKKNVFPQEAFPFERIPGVQGSSIARTADYDPDSMRAFMARDDGEPFGLAVGFNSAHRPWTVGDPSHFDPEELDLPPYLVDTPETREHMTRYLAEIEVLDRQVGRTIDLLDEVGKRDDTLVLFTSEQGAEFPGAKWTLWEQGVRTAMVARWPGYVPRRARTNALVHYVDVLPTLVEAVGGNPEAYNFDGHSFADVLTGQSDGHRDYAYSMHNNVPEGPPYPIRAVTDGEYRYIQNLTPQSTFLLKWMLGEGPNYPTGYWSSWMFAAAQREAANDLVQRYLRRPPVELYHTAEDPHQLNNLAGNPAYDSVKTRLRRALEDWQRRQDDPGTALDSREAMRERREATQLWQEGKGRP